MLWLYCSHIYLALEKDSYIWQLKVNIKYRCTRVIQLSFRKLLNSSHFILSNINLFERIPQIKQTYYKKTLDWVNYFIRYGHSFIFFLDTLLKFRAFTNQKKKKQHWICLFGAVSSLIGNSTIEVLVLFLWTKNLNSCIWSQNLNDYITI